MAADLERLARQFRGDQFKHLRASLNANAQIARQLGAPEHFSADSTPKLQETVPVVEALRLRESFTETEREALKADGALPYTLLGETILVQKESRAKKDKLGFWYVVEAGDRLLAVPSRKIEVAIYPAPDRAFVPDSFNKNVKQQDERVAADAADLRKRLGLEGISEIIPDEASTVTDIIFQHEEATGQWLLGPEYAAAQGLTYVYTRTKNPTGTTGSNVASVGDVAPDGGVDVDYWDRDNGYRNIGAVRMVVPIETK